MKYLENLKNYLVRLDITHIIITSPLKETIFVNVENKGSKAQVSYCRVYHNPFRCLVLKLWWFLSNMSFEAGRYSVGFYALLKSTHIYVIIEMKLRWVLQSMQSTCKWRRAHHWEHHMQTSSFWYSCPTAHYQNLMTPVASMLGSAKSYYPCSFCKISKGRANRKGPGEGGGRWKCWLLMCNLGEWNNPNLGWEFPN